MRTSIALSLIVLAAVVFLSRKEEVKMESEKRNVSKSVELPKAEVSRSEAIKVVKSETVEDIEADMDRIEEKFRRKDVHELESLLSGMEKIIESRNLFALANQGLLTEKDSKELSHFLRSKAVISQLLVEKKLEEVEAM